MAQHNILSKGVILAETVNAFSVVSLSGHLATTASGDKEPVGVAMYEGEAGDRISVMCIGFIDAPQDGTLVLGDAVKADAGAVVKALPDDTAFAVVTEELGAGHVELMLR